MNPIKRGDIYTVDLEPVRGAEQGKVLQLGINNPSVCHSESLLSAQAPLRICSLRPSQPEGLYSLNQAFTPALPPLQAPFLLFGAPFDPSPKGFIRLTRLLPRLSPRSKRNSCSLVPLLILAS